MIIDLVQDVYSAASENRLHNYSNLDSWGSMKSKAAAVSSGYVRIVKDNVDSRASWPNSSACMRKTCLVEGAFSVQLFYLLLCR